MILKRVAIICSVVLLSQVSAAQVAPFKGVESLQRELRDRIFANGVPFYLARYLPSPLLTGLLGSWTGSGSEHEFRNGLPNGVNMLVWYLDLTGFATEVAAACERPSKLTFNESFLATMKQICQWPKDEARSEDVMQAFWIAIMGYDAPEEEWVAWKDFFLQSSYSHRPPREVVQAMILAMTLNPYFLLNH